MAKLNAFGRVAVLTFIKTESTPTLVKAVTKLRLMSDGVILSKLDGVFPDGMKMSIPWKKHAKMKNWVSDKFPLDIVAFKDYATKRGYTEAA
jgi:hypothetical protein